METSASFEARSAPSLYPTTAQDPRLKRAVAIKLLPPDLTRDEAAKQRFLHEAQAASALDHPNICAIYEINETEDGQWYLVMAHYEGETLQERIARGPLALDDAIDMASQVGMGLSEAHGAGIVHRDIKPANLFVTKTGVVKILDFGLAKLAGTEGVTQTGTTVGTVAYMSPEQARGEEVDHRTDIWSLGVVLYEMLAGEPPFQGKNLLSLAEAIRSGEPELLMGEAASLNAVVNKTLPKNPEQRFQTVAELVSELQSPSTGSAAPVIVVAESDVPSIAVLPFSDMSPDKDQDYFCEGMAEEIIDALARLDGLRVVARTSAFQFKGQSPDLRKVGAKLNVKTVLEGSVRKAGSRLRINTQLINADDGYHLWSGRYDKDLDDIFAVQDEIARGVVENLRLTLLGVTETPLIRRPTASLEAYNCYLRGRHARFSRFDAAQATHWFDEAVRHDPSYAAAWAGVAQAHVLAGAYGLQIPGEAFGRARPAVERALALDDCQALAHDALAWIHFWYDWRWGDADREARRAIELNPASADTYATYGHFLANLGRMDDALYQGRKALEIDPLSSYATSALGLAYLVGRRFEEAIAAFKQALDLQPNMTFAARYLSLSYQANSQPEAALAALRDVAGVAASRRPLSFLGHALARSGREAEARQILEELRALACAQFVSPWAFAHVHLGLGDPDAAMNSLEDAYADRSPALVFLLRPEWDPLRADPRFQALLRRMNFPSAGASVDRGTRGAGY